MNYKIKYCIKNGLILHTIFMSVGWIIGYFIAPLVEGIIEGYNYCLIENETDIKEERTKEK